MFQLSWLPDNLVHVRGHSREDSGVLELFTTKGSSKEPSKKPFSNLTNVKVPQHIHGQFNYSNFEITKKKDNFHRCRVVTNFILEIVVI